MISRQLELGFQNQPGLEPAVRSGGRASRANWWFERMRGVVTHARDWPTVPPPAEALRPPAGPVSSGPRRLEPPSKPPILSPRAREPIPRPPRNGFAGGSAAPAARFGNDLKGGSAAAPLKNNTQPCSISGHFRRLSRRNLPGRQPPKARGPHELCSTGCFCKCNALPPLIGHGICVSAGTDE